MILAKVLNKIYKKDGIILEDLSGQKYIIGNPPKDQPIILKWNISRFAEALLPIIHENKEKSIQLAKLSIEKFDELWEEKYYSMMLKKIGFRNNKKKLHPLVNELLELMKKNKADFNNTFLSLSRDYNLKNIIINDSNFILWKKKWKNNIDKFSSKKDANYLMKSQNPIVIPRNNSIEESIKEADNKNIKPLKKLLDVLKNPYTEKFNLDKFIKPPGKKFEQNFRTFCGT